MKCTNWALEIRGGVGNWGKKKGWRDGGRREEGWRGRGEKGDGGGIRILLSVIVL